MTSSYLRSTTFYWLGLLLVALGGGIAGCKYLPWGHEPKQPTSCLDDVAELKSRKFELSMELEGRVKATLLATSYLDQLAKRVDKDAATACGNLSEGLDGDRVQLNRDQFGDGQQATKSCTAAAERIAALREKVSNALAVTVGTLRCTLPPDSYSRCARDCDPNIGRDSSSVSCEEGTQEGRCAAKCKGQCFSKFGDCKGACSGRCSGTCSDEFSGTCGGRCDGTCDGESIRNKACKGHCEGSCSKDGSGSCGGVCKGECGGICQMDMPKWGGKCGGSCAGTCSAEMSSIRCGGVVFPPEIGAECLAMCEAQFIDKLACESGGIEAKVYGDIDKKSADKLEKAIPAHLLPLLKIDESLKGSIETTVERVTRVLDTLVSEVEADPSSKKKVGACLAAAEQHLKADVASFERTFEATAAAILAAKQ